MTLSPSATVSDNALPLHNNSNSGTTVTVTATFNNPGQGAFISSASEYPSTASHLTVSFSGNQITVTSKTGGNNRGLFRVRVTPGAGCGAAQDFYVTVAK